MDVTSLHVRGAIEGSNESLEWVFAHFDPLLEAQIRVRLRSSGAGAEDIQDLRGETWLVVLQKIAKLEPREGRFSPVLARFLSTTALHLCSNFLRRRIRERLQRAPNAHVSVGGSRASMDRFAARTLDALERACQADARLRIAAALDELAPAARDVLVLRLFDQLSNQEIAALLGMEPNTVAVRYKRAIEQLRSRLTEPLFGELWSLHRFREPA